MCGIAGILSKNNNVITSQLIQMCDNQASRGPDAEGIYNNGYLGLCHRRLSIIDLETGDQPMRSYNGDVIIVFNGEIYNYKILRNELTNLGYNFRTKSDTEVLINGYLAYGIDSILDKVEGMFAFALYDTGKEELFLARDKFGEKPLYYVQTDDELRFASELKAFKFNFSKYHIDNVALNYFFALTYIPSPYTIFEEVRKLEAGYYFKFNKELKSEAVKYFDLKQKIIEKTKIVSFEEAKSYFHKIIVESVRQRIVSDVPVGVFLSGGVDSSIIACIMNKLSDKPINTFTIGFNEKSYDESNRAQIVADFINANHHIKYLNYSDVIEQIDDIILYFDEPFGDSSAIPSYFVAKLAREKVKVVLTGDCGDELFGGYEKYLIYYYTKKFNNLPRFFQSFIKMIVLGTVHNRITNTMLRKFKKVIANSTLSEFDIHYNLMCLGFNDSERIDLLNDNYYHNIKPELEQIYHSLNNSTVLEKEQFTDIRIVLEGDMFVKADRVSMKNSLETRPPMIDSNIVYGTFAIPSDFKIRGNKKKYILKEAFKDDLPKRTLRYSKRGFGVPIDYWFRNELKRKLEDVINPSLINNQGIFKYETVKRLFDEHQSGRENHKGKLWNIYVFQKWYLNYMSE